MPSRASIVVLSAEAQTHRAVSSAVETSQRLALEALCRTVPELVARLEDRPAPAVLVDIDPQPRRALKELERVIGDFPQTRFIVLAKELESELVIAAMQAGARHYLLKGSLEKDLEQVLERLVSFNGAGDSQGALVTVLSAGGGSGATTVAVNLAGELHLLAALEPALVVDLDPAYGGAGAYLGLRGAYGVADVLGHGGRIDSELVATTAIDHPQGVHLLASPATTHLPQAAPPGLENLEALAAACRGAYRYTVADAPRLPLEAAATLAQASLVTLIVLQLSVKDIRVARQMLTALVERGVPARRLRPVANRYRKRGRMITLDEARRGLGGAEIIELPNDFRSAVTACNFGKLLAHAARRSPLREGLRRLAAGVAKAHATRKHELMHGET
jgi:pilus assembly protein CpaE